MWPSEGSVSDDALDLAISKGIDWFATDEDILFKSLSLFDKRYKGLEAFDRRLIYQPYRLKRDSRQITAVFRDKNLSDMISFTYNSWNPRDAANDLLGHFRRIGENLRRDMDRGLAAIVMDGENAWEYYEDNAREFFSTLYANLERGDNIGSTTVSDFLCTEPAKKTISNIFCGSWINHNFDVWIGQEQDNMSWEYLSRARKDLTRFTRELHRKEDADGSALRKAWQEFYISEGSDWNWWYTGKLAGGKDNPFDKLYRTHLKNIYKTLKKPVPDFLKISIA
jgi:alpha-amylase/alpha-mannosidase (GH57 family)